MSRDCPTGGKSGGGGFGSSGGGFGNSGSGFGSSDGGDKKGSAKFIVIYVQYVFWEKKTNLVFMLSG